MNDLKQMSGRDIVNWLDNVTEAYKNFLEFRDFGSVHVTVNFSLRIENLYQLMQAMNIPASEEYDEIEGSVFRMRYNGVVLWDYAYVEEVE